MPERLMLTEVSIGLLMAMFDLLLAVSMAGAMIANASVDVICLDTAGGQEPRLALTWN